MRDFKILFLATGLFFSFCLSRPTIFAEDKTCAYSHFLAGNLYELDSRYGKAASEYQSALNCDPESAYLNMKIGEMFFYEGNFSQAEKFFKESIRRRETAQTHALMGRLYRTMARGRADSVFTDKAEDSYQRALALGADLFVSLELAQIYIEKEKMGEAEILLEKILRADPAIVPAYLMLAGIRAFQGKTDEAEALLKRAYKENPYSRDALFSLADFYEKTNRCADAVPILEKIVEWTPQDFISQGKLGICYALEGRAKEAIAILEPLENLRAMGYSNFELTYALSLAYRDEKDYDNAIIAWLKFLQANPQNLEARRQLAHIYIYKKDFENALSEYRVIEDALVRNVKKSKEARSALAEILTRQGYLFFALEQPSEAGEAFERAFRLDRGNPDEKLYTLASQAWLEAKDSVRALAVCVEALQHFKESVSLRVILAEIYIIDGKTKDAQKTMEKILADAPSEEGFLQVSGFFSRHKEKNPAWKSKSFEALETALKHFPKSDKIYFQTGALYERDGEFETAENYLRRAISLNPLNADALNYLGYMFADKGENLDEALDMLKRAVSLDAENGAYLDSLGWAYFKLQNYEKAEEYLKRAIERMDDPVVRDHLGDLYYVKGFLEKAIAEWEKALQGDMGESEKVREKLESAKKDLSADN